MKLKAAEIEKTFTLTQEETARYGHRLADQVVELARLRDAKKDAVKRLTEAILRGAKKDAVKRLTEAIELQEGEVARLTCIIRSGKELRTITVQMLPDLDSNRMTYLDPETGQVVAERALTAEELQGDQPMGE